MGLGRDQCGQPKSQPCLIRSPAWCHPASLPDNQKWGHLQQHFIVIFCDSDHVHGVWCHFMVHVLREGIAGQDYGCGQDSAVFGWVQDGGQYRAVYSLERGDHYISGIIIVMVFSNIFCLIKYYQKIIKRPTTGSFAAWAPVGPNRSTAIVVAVRTWLLKCLRAIDWSSLCSVTFGLTIAGIIEGARHIIIWIDLSLLWVSTAASQFNSCLTCFVRQLHSAIICQFAYYLFIYFICFRCWYDSWAYGLDFAFYEYCSGPLVFPEGTREADWLWSQG